MLEKMDHRIYNDRGELAVIVQHAYSLAALRIQPAVRGALARLELPDRRWELISYVSVLEIWRVLKACSGSTCGGRCWPGGWCWVR